jgi:HlyD family secretion protein
MNKDMSDSEESIHQSRSTPSFGRSAIFKIVLGIAGIAGLSWVLITGGFLSNTEVEVVTAVAQLAKAESPTNQPEKLGKGELLFQASGWIEPDPFPLRVTSLYSGVVKEVHILEGEKVSKDQVIVTMVEEDAQLELRKAESELAQAKAEEGALGAEIALAGARKESAVSRLGKEQAVLEDIDDTLRRLETLPVGAVSQQELIQARLRSKSQGSILQAAKTEISEQQANIRMLEEKLQVQHAKTAFFAVSLDMASLALERTRVRSPADGVVLRLLASPGARMMLHMDRPDSSTAAILYEEGKLQARIDVPLADAAQIFLGQAVSVTSSLLPNESFEGTVTRILGEADLQRNTLQVKVSLQEPDPRLRPEMLCRAKFFGQPKKIKGKDNQGSLQVFIPKKLRTPNGTAEQTLWVLSADGTSADVRNVRFGKEEKEGFVIVQSGLRPGDRILVNPPEGLKPGDRVNAKEVP